MIKRSWKSLLASAAVVSTMAAGSVASADDAHTLKATTSESTVEQLFAHNDSPLTTQLASLSATTDSVYCGEDICGEDGCIEGCDAEDDENSITFGGWVQLGYHSGVTPNGTGRNDAGSFNNHPHRVNLHQSWLYAEKVADGSNGLDWGFRADVVYGVDGPDTQAFGNPAGRFDNGGSFTRGAGYGWAIPQLYAEVAVGDVSIKAGHFYTLIGYEVVTAPDNFFYSHSLTFFNSEPFTHSGVLATYTASDDVTLYGGWTAGWDTAFSSVDGGSNFLGGFSIPAGDNATFTYITTIGNFGARSNGASGYAHSLLLDVALADDLNWVIQSDLVRIGSTGDDDVGINTYLLKTITDKVGIGARAEWWKDEGNSQHAITVGLNFKPEENLIIRPEIRHDWHLEGADDEVTTFGVDAIFTF